MRVAGFTIIRNAVQLDYPIVEAIQSILPLCDIFLIAVGQSDDQTLQLIQAISSEKIRIMETVWDDSLRSGGRVLAEETNKAFDAIPPGFDWCFYIQGDEVLHEGCLDVVKTEMKRHLDNPVVEGLLFKYRHFYGSYDYLGSSRRWYRREVRIIRHCRSIRSYRDAQGFRKKGNKLKVKLIDAHIHHYGWVKHPYQQQLKQRQFHKLWHNDEWLEKNIPDTSAFDYSKIDSLEKFTGQHPKVMQQRIAQKNWQFEFDPTRRSLSWKNRLSAAVESWTGYRVGEYKNYILLP